MIYLGVDPGQSGGIAIFNKPNLLLLKMPETPKDILRFFSKFKNQECICYIEQLHGMPGMGGTAMFKFGKNNGYLEMALLASGLPAVYISPQKWQKEFGVGTKSNCKTTSEWKNKLKNKAEQLYPKECIHLWGSDAILIMEYGRRNYVV